MKINGSTDSVPLEKAGGKPTSRTATPAEQSSAPAVQLSGTSSQLATSDAGAFDATRVENLKQAIRDGRFEVDSGLVADKLIASVHELFGKVH